ncbi:mycothiol transferase [Streptomyces sp. NPDC054775]
MLARLTPRDPQLLTMALAEAAAAWQAEIAHGRELVRRRTAGRLRLAARARSSSRRRPGVSLRWIMVHMIEEYARHNGRADLIRERINGATGA